MEPTNGLEAANSLGAAHRRLSAGIHEIVEPIRLSGLEPGLFGERQDGEIVTRIRRGRLPDGRLYAGHLIQIEDAAAPILKDLIVEGARFSVSDGVAMDARHPLNPDRTAPDFMCASMSPEPECYSPAGFVSAFAADIAVRSCRGGLISDIWCDAPVRIGMAIGHGVADLRLQGCRVSRAGDYGVWIGFGGPLEDPKLPVNPTYRAHQPRSITLEAVTIERCGAAGLFSEAIDVSVLGCRFLENCHDAPYDDEGGQVTADYKSDGLHIRDSLIIGAPAFVRRRRNGETVLLGAFGIEACGSNLLVENTIIEGNSREGVQIVGARNVALRRGVRLFNNHMAQVRWPDYPGHGPRPGVSITTTREMAEVGAMAADITLEDVRCENGLGVWSDGQVPGMRLHGLVVTHCDLGGPDHQGIYVGLDSEGESVAGLRWSLDTEA